MLCCLELSFVAIAVLIINSSFILLVFNLNTACGNNLCVCLFFGSFYCRYEVA